MTLTLRNLRGRQRCRCAVLALVAACNQRRSVVVHRVGQDVYAEVGLQGGDRPAQERASKGRPATAKARFLLASALLRERRRRRCRDRARKAIELKHSPDDRSYPLLARAPGRAGQIRAVVDVVERGQARNGARSRRRRARRPRLRRIGLGNAKAAAGGDRCGAWRKCPATRARWS